MSSIATIKIGKHNDPIFFYYGRRVNLETGYNLAIRHGLINPGSYVDQWFIDNCEIKACDFPFLIANETDAPCKSMVTQAGRYISPSYAGENKVDISHQSTDVASFGLDITKNDDGTYYFKKTRESIATYSDGLKREWQGKSEFSLHPWYFVFKEGAA